MNRHRPYPLFAGALFLTMLVSTFSEFVIGVLAPILVDELGIGEAVIGAHFNVGAWDLIDKGAPIGFAVPKEGVWATDARLHLVKGSKQKAAAEQFINTALTPTAATCLATKLYVGPSVMNVRVPADVARKLPWGVNGSIEQLSLFDWAAINSRRSEITDAWNRQVAPKR
jgi:putative spermidine/putrescine transport system substrate-binding protein